MKNIKELNEKLLWEIDDKDKDENEKKKKDDKEKENEEKKSKKGKSSSLKSKEFRDTLQQYKGRITGTAELNVSYKELKKKLEDEITGVNWTIPNVKKAFEVVTTMIGVQPEENGKKE